MTVKNFLEDLMIAANCGAGLNALVESADGHQLTVRFSASKVIVEMDNIPLIQRLRHAEEQVRVRDITIENLKEELTELRTTYDA